MVPLYYFKAIDLIQELSAKKSENYDDFNTCQSREMTTGSHITN